MNDDDQRVAEILSERDGVLCFEVPLGRRRVTAYLSDKVWMARFGHGCSDATLAERYRENRSRIDAAVSRRAGDTGRAVVLRVQDL